MYGGVETGGTWTVCGLGSGSGRLLVREQFPTGGPQETLARIVEFFERHERPLAVGVGAFGPLDLDPRSPTWGHVTTTPKPGWQHASVAGVVRQRLELPVALDTDVGAAAVGEHRWGAGVGAESLCYLTVGTGIGAGLVASGPGERGRPTASADAVGSGRPAGASVYALPWHGLIHPEVGHLRVPRDPRDEFPGSCPVHGDCWEGLASGEAIAARWGVDPEQLPDDHPAWELEAGYIALGMLAIVSIACPHLIVAGGGVLTRRAVLDRVRRRLPKLISGYLPSPLLGERIDDYIVPPALGDDAGVLGAIALAQRLIGREAGLRAG